MDLPPPFVHNIRTLHGDAGDEWLRNLPETLASLAECDDLVLGPPFPNLSYNYVCPATRRADGEPVVLKVGLRSDGDFDRERRALLHFDGAGVARLREHAQLSERNVQAMLLERILPGGTLWERVVDAASDEEATRIAARVMRRLNDSAKAVLGGKQFAPLKFWFRDFDNIAAQFESQCVPFPRALAERAERLANDLLESSPDDPVLLHGDLHHGNILSAHESRDGSVSWLAIDPKGVGGDPAFEVGALLRNPLDRLWTLPDTPRILARRLDLLSDELNLPRERLRDWGFVQVVLSAWWSVQDHGTVGENDIALAALLAELR